MTFFSIIIPVYNACDTLPVCLQAVQQSDFRDWELIVVDDDSTDGSAALAVEMGARVMRTHGRTGPAHARNLGASVAHGRYLFFLDADCRLHPDTLSRAARHLQADPTLDALFGSYDDTPAAPNFISQYKNLFHHYIHQTSRETAVTFWAGCGAIRRECFLELGGFDAARYPRPAIEDIELGYRLTAVGGRIRLAKDVQVTHLKKWTLASLLRSDIGDRAIPWSRLLHGQTAVPADLNLQKEHRLSAAALAVFLLSAWHRLVQSRRLNQSRSDKLLSLAAFFSALTLLWLNRDLYQFFRRKRGWFFALRAIPLHWLYYFYGTAVYLLTAIASNRSRR
ncbi:MAG: glycosyltransferase family 2 protein [Chloroflexi bacterium]|nr:glycosyltransferase family 2 protein [Chloroflexota bacterium]